MSEADDSFVLGCVYLMLSLLVMVSNGVVVLVIIKMRELHLPTLWIIAHMAVWDFLLGIHYLVFSVPSAFLNQFAYSTKLVGAVACLRIFIVGENLFSIVTAVVDRYIAVLRPLSYTRIATKKNFGLAALISVFLNTGRVLFIVLPAEKFLHNKISAMCVATYATWGGTVGSSIPVWITLGMIIFCSVSIFREHLRGRRQIRPSGASPGILPGKFTVMVLSFVVIFCVSYFPSVVADIWNFDGKGNVPDGFLKFVIVSLLCNSVWNVFIYTATYTPFRDALISVFCKSYYRKRMQAEIRVTFVQEKHDDGVSIDPIQ